jgi:hypothetical protein
VHIAVADMAIGDAGNSWQGFHNGPFGITDKIGELRKGHGNVSAKVIFALGAAPASIGDRISTISSRLAVGSSLFEAAPGPILKAIPFLYYSSKPGPADHASISVRNQFQPRLRHRH